MPKPSFFTLDDAEKVRELAGTLEDPEIEIRRTWEGPLRAFPGLQHLLLERNNAGGLNEHLNKVAERSPLTPLLDPDGQFLPLKFGVRPPLLLHALDVKHLDPGLDRSRLMKMLRPLDRLPANPEAIQTILLDYYTSRGLSPKIALDLEAVPPTLSIFETIKISRILLPVELSDWSLAQRIVYESLPHRVFAAFRKNGRDLLAVTFDDDRTKREIDLRTLVVDAEPAERAGSFDFPQLPSVDTSLLAEIQQRLLPLEHAAALFDFKPEMRLFDLVIDPTTSEEAAAADANDIAATATTPPNAPETTSRPHAPPDIQPSPVAAARNANPTKSGNAPRKQHKHFLGGGIEYRPDQGIRALGSFQRAEILGDDLLGIEVGGMGEGFWTGRYSRNYILFDTLGFPLSVDVNGGSDFERQRLIAGSLTNERRKGATVRADLEAFRDRSGQRLGMFVEARRETVTLTPPQPAPETAANVSTLDVGLAYTWRRWTTRRPHRIRLEPSVRLAPGLGTTPRYRRSALAVQYHQSIEGPIEVESRFQGHEASAATPLFDLPSLGGPDSVRGFRADESVGRRLWSWQNELWLPVLGGGPPSKIRDFVRRNVRVVALYDLGAAAAEHSTAIGGFRQGAGVGLRVRYQGVIVETDWAYGFGAAEDSRPGRGRFHFNVRLP